MTEHPHTTQTPGRTSRGAYEAAEAAAATAYPDADPARLRDALVASWDVLARAGLLRHHTRDITEADAVDAAKLLARMAHERSGFARYLGNGYRVLLKNFGDVELAHKRASRELTANDEQAVRELAEARYTVTTWLSNRDQGGDQV